MKTLRLSIVFGLLLSTPLFAQEKCDDVETIYVIQDIKKINHINNNGCQNSEIFIALPKSQKPSNFNIAITQNASTFLMEIKDPTRGINGSIYGYNNVSFGGDFKIGNYTRFNGGFKRDTNTQILEVTHNFEYAIYKLDLNRYTIEPTIHQFARFIQIPQQILGIREMNLQPLSVGVFVRKFKSDGREFKAGLTAGPSMNYYTTPTGTTFKYQGQVNLRLTIPLPF